jgi:hypothetical protein
MEGTQSGLRGMEITASWDMAECSLENLDIHHQINLKISKLYAYCSVNIKRHNILCS